MTFGDDFLQTNVYQCRDELIKNFLFKFYGDRLPICLWQVLLREIVQISKLKDLTTKEDSARFDIAISTIDVASFMWQLS